MQIQVPRFMVSGVTSGVGKSLIGLGLAVALRKRKVGVSCGVRGPNLQQAVLYHRVTRRFTHTFDRLILSSSQMLNSLYHASLGADVVLIEGSDGLYDGMGAGSLRGSDHELAELTGTPILLISDVRGFGSSLAALVKGYREFTDPSYVAGIIANRIQEFSEHEEERDRTYFDAALQASNQPTLLGALPEADIEQVIPTGKRTYQEHGVPSLPFQFLIELGNLIESYIDVSGVLRLAGSAYPLDYSEPYGTPSGRRTRIAVSDDACFSVCFQDNLELLKFFGAEIVTFSPLADVELPQRTAGVYLTGGNLLEYGRELAMNTNMRQSISEFFARGGLVYSEGGGTAYLAKSFSVSSEPLSGVGIWPGSVKLVPGRLMYSEAIISDHSILGRPGTLVKGITAGEWSASIDPAICGTQISLGGELPFKEGMMPSGQSLLTFCFNHFGSNPDLARSIVDASEVNRSLKSGS